jgi:hypothetical protein
MTQTHSSHPQEPTGVIAMQTLHLSRESCRIGGVLLLSIVTIEFGGLYLTRVASGHVELTNFQVAFSRAGHAHAGVLVTLSLIALVLADATNMRGVFGYLVRLAIPIAAILMSAGFFASSIGAGRTEPNGFIVVLWLGAASLTVGVVSLGVALLRTPAERSLQQS